jgi:putative two-component system response regulator
VVDDIAGNVSLLRSLLERDGYAVSIASSGGEALAAAAGAPPDLVLLDVMMPGIDGFETCRRLKALPRMRLVPVVLVTALHQSTDRITGIDAGADDFLTKPFNPHELSARVRSLLRIKRYTDELDSAESVIMSLALTIEARDACTEGHCQRLSAYAAALGRHLGLPPADVEALERGGILHDIGKIGVPDAVLLKPGALTPDERTLIRTHTTIGDRLCGELRLLDRVRPIVRWHHERLDGSGYPDGLRGDRIPLIAQIVSVVDVFDALTTRRPYREPLTIDQAFDELHREAARGWRRRDLVDAFVGLAERGALPLASPGAAAGRERP